MKLLASFAIAMAVASLALLPSARAGGVVTIDATQYLPLGQFDAWEMIDKDAWDGDHTQKLEPQIVSIGKVQVVNGIVLYNVKSKLFGSVEDFVMQLGVDQGVIYLFGAKMIDPQVDFGDDNITVPTVIFDAPVPIGDTSTALDADFATTPITATVEVSIDIGPKTLTGDLVIEGSVTARWDSAAPIDTPLGTLGLLAPGDANTGLAQFSLNIDFTYSSADSDINDVLSGQHTVKGVSGVVGPGLGFVQIDGEGQQPKIVNRAVLPGVLLSSPADPDAFTAPPPGDMTGFAVGIPTIVSLDGITAGGITDGTLTLANVLFDHALAGGLDVSLQVSSPGAGPVDLLLHGSARMSAKTGGLEIQLSGHTKKLTDIVKQVDFSVKQELLPPFDGGEPLHLTWKAGKDPITKLPIGGTLEVPIAPFVATSVSLVMKLLVDDPKVKKGFLSIGTSSRNLAAEGVLTLPDAADGMSLGFPVCVLEKAKLKEGLPTVRSYSLYQTGETGTRFSWRATSTSALDYLLSKFSGKLLGTKIAPLLPDVELSAL